MRRWTHRPEGANWGEFGADDELGRVNLIGREQVLNGIRAVTEGRSICLSLPLDLPGHSRLNPRRKPPQLSPTMLGRDAYLNFPLSEHDPVLRDVVSDDHVVLWTQYSTQWDSLAHVGAMFDATGSGTPQRVYYNGFRADIDIACEERGEDRVSHARRLGIQNMAEHGMQGRAVLLDLLRVFGPGRTLVDRDRLDHAMRDLDVQVEPGDMLVLRTGFAERVVQMDGDPDPEVLDRTGAVLDGSDALLLDWISESGIAALCADNYAIEDAGTDGHACGLKLPLHHHCLFKLGLPLAELWYLPELAAELQRLGRTRFLLTAPPLRLPGAIGSPVTPIATV